MRTNTMVGFDLNKFMGTWYVISRTNRAPGVSCVNSVMTFTKTPTDVRVRSECLKGGSVIDSKSGVVTMPNHNDTSKLVIIPDAFFSTRYNYWIYQTDYNDFALTGNNAGHVWILSRKQQMPYCAYIKILDKAASLNLDVKSMKHDINKLSVATHSSC